MTPKLYEVAVDAPISSPLTYKVEDSTSIVRGDSVKVPLGSRTVDAVVLNVAVDAGEYKVKAIKERHPERKPLPEPFLKWLEWLSKYYMHPIGQVMKLAFPPLKRQLKPTKSRKSPVIPEVPSTLPPALTEEQKNCIHNIDVGSGFSVHLVHGVTGSGKTEIYLQLIDKVIEQGKTALILVPEISLTPQLLNRFASRFPNKVAVIHSHLTDREKTNQWWLAHNKEKPILLGARSALFCPREDLGLIIIDEEHEPSFKQDEKLKYNARDAAIVLAQNFACPIILGSATPSLESWSNAQQGKYQLHQLKKRVSERSLPIIEIVSLAESEKHLDLPFWLSPQLKNKMDKALSNQHQVALFLNRRGVAQYVQCFDCGFVYECPNCEISLTLHAKSDLVCHYCNYTTLFKERCPECESDKISSVGLGTEQVEVDIKKLFPEARLARADRDEINSREDLEHLIQNMENHQIDILIGTQMIAKGLDFPQLNLVGLLLADVGFHLPDFRASERSFQLITQVAGRAGRHSELPGEVVVQTFNPNYDCLRFALNNNYEEFAQHELQQRTELNYPPKGRLGLVRVIANNLVKAQDVSWQLAQRLKALKDHRDIYKSLGILGPSPAPMAKLRNKYRYHILLKAPKVQVLHALLNEVLPDFSKGSLGVKVQIDIDPYNML